MRFSILLFLGTLLLLQSGCALIGIAPKKKDLPIVFTTAPSLEQVKAEINRKYAGIQSLSSENAVLSMSSAVLPLRSCTIAYEKSRNLRVRGGLASGMGTEVDFGSNEEFFWFWMKRDEKKRIYYANHEQFAQSPIRGSVPVEMEWLLEPQWLIESLGILEMRDRDEHFGPYRDEEGNLRITSRISTVRGVFERTITIHPQTAAFLKHEIKTPDGQPFITTLLSDHTTDETNRIAYARRIEIYLAKTQDKITINLGTVNFNSPSGFHSDAFKMPQYSGYLPIDLCSPEMQQMMLGGNLSSARYPPHSSLPVYASSPANPGYTPLPNELPFASTPQEQRQMQGTATHAGTFVQPLR